MVSSVCGIICLSSVKRLCSTRLYSWSCLLWWYLFTSEKCNKVARHKGLLAWVVWEEGLYMHLLAWVVSLPIIPTESYLGGGALYASLGLVFSISNCYWSCLSRYWLVGGTDVSECATPGIVVLVFRWQKKFANVVWRKKLYHVLKIFFATISAKAWGSVVVICAAKRWVQLKPNKFYMMVSGFCASVAMVTVLLVTVYVADH